MSQEKSNKEINEEFAHVQALIEKTDKENPKPEDLAEMKRLLNKNSTLVQINDLSERAYRGLIKTISPSALMQELTERQIEEKRDSFGYKDACVIEKMLIDQVILCYLRLNYFEMIYTGKFEKSHSLDLGIYWEKRLNAAQKRFLNACEALSKVRKLISDAELKEAQAKTKRSQSTLIAQKILEKATKY